jgi:hypothetical protein
MPYEVTDPFWRVIDHWQTLITGLLALAAAVATIWATIASANREVAAANAQTQLALSVERRSMARESYAFHAMLEATMGIVVDDVHAALDMIRDRLGQGHSALAYQARQKVQKTGFADMRSALVHIGGQTVTPFLRLDKEIDDLSSQWTLMPTGGDPIKVGAIAGLAEQLARVELQAVALREEAVNGMHRCNAVLALPQVGQDI